MISGTVETASSEPPAIVVAGDIVVDHHIYEGARRSPTSRAAPGVREVKEPGGACLIHRLLVSLRGDSHAPNGAALGTKPPTDTVGSHHAFAVWKPCPAEPNSKRLVWRASLDMGYGHDDDCPVAGEMPPEVAPPFAPTPIPPPGRPRVLVLDDAGILFRHREHSASWLLSDQPREAPDWIVLKTGAPVAQGDLWYEVTERFRDRLICIVSADDLRREFVKLSTGLSWEQTVEDLREGLETNAALNPLLTCRGVIVTFSVDGAFWLDCSSPADPVATLVCDAGTAEGELARATEGSAFGYLSCMVAAVAHTLAGIELSDTNTRVRPPLAPAIGAGLAAMRNLLREGHGPSEDAPSGFPAARLAGIIRALEAPASSVRDAPVTKFAEVRIPWDQPSRTRTGDMPPWTIVEMSQRPLHSTTSPSLVGLARQLVLRGVQALGRLPHARFGNLVTADRLEIEALRTIQRALLAYRAESRPKHPLSIGVFGPPGSGKSFGVREIATSIYGEKAWLEFNISQFSSVADLNGAFHQVRDKVLGGVTPVVLWDEFDAREYEWLQYLLAPMQDGRFQEGLVTHTIGKCVFVFAGGTSVTFDEFGPDASDLAQLTRFAMRKGPDFRSRLDQHYDVLGPNQRTLPSPNGRTSPRVPDPTDVCHPLRRAILIRAFLGATSTERIDVDPDLLDALLQVPRYKHGVRSLEKLMRALRSGESGVMRRSSLPTPRSLEMYVDAERFLEIMERNTVFRQAAVIELLASAIHETWRELSRREGWPMQPRLEHPFEELASVDKEENRAAARRMPEILALAGLMLMQSASEGDVEQGPERAKLVREHLEHHLERLAEAEHDGWMEHRKRNGWTFSEHRDDDKKLHDALRPYAKLRERDREKDRSSVRHFPEVAQLAGYEIGFIGGEGLSTEA